MDTNLNSDRHLKNTRIIWVLMFIAIIIYVQFLYLVPALDISSYFSLSGSILTIIEIILVFFSLYSLASIFIFRDKYLLKGMVKKYRDKPRALFNFFIVCFAMTESIGIYGLMLVILGAEWYIASLFFVVSGITMIFCYPTSSRWNKLLEVAETLA